MLSDWLTELAEHAGWLIQTTSVPGVAQRTGATIYYAELFRKGSDDEPEPVLALMPTSGEVDVVIAAELMEAGRAMQRGLVTPDRTTLIASSHRAYAIAEKSAPSDGRADDAPVYEAARSLAKRVICFDMAQVAETHDAVISAALFGALAGARVLPFERRAFEAAIARGGVGVKASLAGFADAYARAVDSSAPPAISMSGVLKQAVEDSDYHAPFVASSPAQAALDSDPGPVAAPLREQIDALPAPARAFAIEGVRKLIDYMDVAYAREYLRTLDHVAGLDAKGGGEARQWRLTAATARYLALTMAYEDTIRVADLKTRASRFARVRREVRAQPGQIVGVTEFMHPRVEELADTLPVGMGRWLLDTPWARALAARLFSRGRRLRTTSLSGFVPLWLLGRLRTYRRRTLRFQREMHAITDWLGRVERMAAKDYDLACEMVECARVLKGYGETAERGRRHFDTLLRTAEHLVGRPDAHLVVRRLREAALKDDDGAALKIAVEAVGTI